MVIRGVAAVRSLRELRKNCIFIALSLSSSILTAPEDGSEVGGLFAQLPPDTQAIVRPFLYSKYVVQDIASKLGPPNASAAGGGDSGGTGVSTAAGALITKGD